MSYSYLFGLAGFCLPNLFSKLGGVLFIALIGILITRIVAIFLPFNTTLVDWISAIVFSLYIGYDMYRASKISRTVHSALQVAITLYLDIIIIFTSILSINTNNK